MDVRDDDVASNDAVVATSAVSTGTPVLSQCSVVQSSVTTSGLSGSAGTTEETTSSQKKKISRSVAWDFFQ